jgi:hypothetical protein
MDRAALCFEPRPQGYGLCEAQKAADTKVRTARELTKSPLIDGVTASRARDGWLIARPRQVSQHIRQGCVTPMRLDEARDVVAARALTRFAGDYEVVLALFD